VADTEKKPDSTQPWGRVANDGTVYVRERAGERAVGSYPDGTPEEALAYFERKYSDLAGQVTLLEQRVKHGAPAKDVAKAINRLSDNVDGANAVGDLESLTTRLAALSSAVDELEEQQSIQAKTAIDDAIAERTKIVEDVEKLAAKNPQKMQWKQTTQTLDALFTRWQAHQHDAPRIPQTISTELWGRFRAAREKIEQNRRTFFAELDVAHRDARTQKEKLVDQAEALVSQGPDAIPAYRLLLTKWKKVGRAGKRFDDTLWAQFKAVGDILYNAKAEIDARDNEEFEANLALKQAILDEAEPLLTETDHERARTKLVSLQRRWDQIGKVPRDKTKVVEDRLRKIETAVRHLDEEHWRTNNPDTKARSEGLVGQLRESIATLESQLVEAQTSDDKASITALEEALATRRLWLDAIDK
jgi:hypothetical protein